MSHELLEKLQQPFILEDIEWRIQSWGKSKNGDYWARVLAYVTNRAIMNRLDDVVGPVCWQNEFKEWHNGSQLCGISIFCNDQGQAIWVTKWDGAECTNIESIKGGLSDAMKRAAVQWGIGRYLYKLESNFAQQISIEKQKRENGWHYAGAEDTKNRYGGGWHEFYWLPPDLPEWALPEGHPAPPKDTGLKKPQIPENATGGDPSSETQQIVDTKGALELCSNFEEAKRVWESASKSVRKAIGADYIKNLKEKIGV